MYGFKEAKPDLRGPGKDSSWRDGKPTRGSYDMEVRARTEMARRAACCEQVRVG